MNRFVVFLNTLLRRCLWLGALGLVLAALYVSLGRQLVPLVAEYRLEVQDKARAMLGMPVALGSLEGRWEGFAPRLLIHDVLLGTGDSAVRLDSLSVIPDLAGSLWARELRLAALELEGVQLSLTQAADGQWRVEGLPDAGNTARSSPDLQKVFAELSKVRRLALFDSQLTVEARGESPFTLSYANFELAIDGQALRLDGRLVLPDGQPLAMHLQARMQPQQWRDSQAELYLNLPQSDWAAWLPRRLTRDWHLQRLRAGGEVWASWRDQGLSRAVTRLHVAELQGAYAEREPVSAEDLALNLYVERSDQGYRLQLDGLAFTLGDIRWPETRLLLSRNAAGDQWRLQSDRITLAPLAALTNALAPLPETAAVILEDLAPTGNLRNLRIDYRPEAPLSERVELAANLDGVGISTHGWIPAVQNVNGILRGNLGGGELRFDNQDFSLHLAELFPAPWAYRQGRGSLRWTLDEEAFSLVAPYLRLEGDEGHLAGDFVIRLMRDPAAEDYMDLRVGLSDGDARYTEKYLPTRSPAMSPALSDWLVTAIRGGTVEQGYFQYQGSIGKDAPPTARSLSLYFGVRDAELAFQPGWPVLREGRGEVLIEDSGVRVRLAEGRMLDSRVHDALAEVPHAENGKPPRLAIQGSVDGTLVDGLSLLQVAPIGTTEIFAGWTARGPLSGTLDLDIPLGGGERPHVVVDFASTNAALWIPQANLGLEQVGGRFRYDTARGFSASDIQARALGRTVRGKATATGRPEHPATRIEAYGEVTLKALLAWLGSERSLPASGELPYQLRLDIGGESSQLQIDSSLLGATLKLPAPFGKPAGQRRDTSFRMTLGDEPRRYMIKHGDLAALTFQAPAGDWRNGGGELVLGGGAANLRGGAGLYVRGRVPELDLDAWQTLLAGHGEAGEGQSAASLLKRAQLDIARFKGFGQEIENLGIDLRRAGNAWSLGLASSSIAGTLLRPDDDAVPIKVDLEHVRVPAPAPGAEGSERKDPLAAVDPANFPPMDIAIDEVWLGQDLLGPWSLRMRPASGGVAFTELDLGLKGLNVSGSGGWNASRSWYKGRMQGKNLADVLMAWGFAPTVSSDSFRLDADAHWPGSPAFVGLERLSGDLSARLQHGQFSEVEGGAQALRVFGLLNFNSIGRRLRLDFSDLFGKGLSYDRIKGELSATEGVYLTKEPITITGPSSNLELDGRLDMVRDRIDAKLLVTLPVSNNLPLAALIAGAPAIGGALFVVDKLLGDRVARFASVQYKVEGPWRSPEIIFDKPFEKPN